MTADRSSGQNSKRHEAERFVLDYESPIIQYEHLHRYVLASRCVKGLRVLDLASGSGYGSRLLRAAGADVVAVDLEIDSARRASPAICADARKLPFPDSRFDAVVCFEAVEHVEQPEEMLREIDRVLQKEGIAIISTPDRETYSDRMGNRNPFHLAEMTIPEFSERLAAYFPHVQLHGQSIWAGSWIAPLDSEGRAPGDDSRRVDVLLQPSEFGNPDAPRAPWVAPGETRFPTPLYLLALCARSKKRAEALRAKIGAESVLHDTDQWLTGSYLELEHFFLERIHKLEEHSSNLEAKSKEREGVLAGIRAHAANLEESLGEARQKNDGATEHAANLESKLRKGDEYIESLREHVRNLEARLEEGTAHSGALEEHIRNLESKLAERTSHSESLEEHVRNLESQLEERAAHTEGLEAHVGNLEDQLEERSTRSEELEAHARNLEDQLEERSTHTQGLEAHVRNLEANLRSLEANVETRTAEVANRDGQIGDLRNQLTDVEDKLALLRDQSFEARNELKRIQSALWYRALRRSGLIR